MPARQNKITSMTRMKTCDVPHKGLRNALSQVSLLAGRTNYSTPQEVQQLFILGSDVFTILNIHAADENEVTLSALESRCPGSSRHDVEDHEQLHFKQSKLEKLLSEIHAESRAGKDVTAHGGDFYLAFSEFHGKYLEHTAEEERVTQPLALAIFF
jgi:hypothetical protein